MKQKHVPRSKTSTGSTLASDPPPPFSTRLSRPLSTSERTTTSASQPPSSIDSHAAELEFLGHGAPSDTADLHSKTATLVTRDAFAASPAGHYPFKSLLGTVRKQCAAGFPSNTRKSSAELRRRRTESYTQRTPSSTSTSRLLLVGFCAVCRFVNSVAEV